MPSTPKREMRLKAFSSAYEYVKQYPHQSSNGRRELRAMEKENQKERGNSLPRDRSKMNSVDTVDTAIYAPALNGEQSNGTHGDGYHERQNVRDSTRSDGTAHRSKSVHSLDSELPRSPNFVDMDDGAGQTAAPVEPSQRGIHIPTRTR